MTEQNLKDLKDIKCMNNGVIRSGYMVCTTCMTYNQNKYIGDTLRGFEMQNTDFPVVYVVVDDASNDGEQIFLRKWAMENLFVDNSIDGFVEKDYGSLLEARHKDNVNAHFVIILLRENHYGKKSKLPYIAQWRDHSKYCAICEGDDYWITPDKLKLQVAFLEENPDYVLCHTDFELTTGRYRNHGNNQLTDGNVFPSSIIEGLDGIGTLTVVYRTSSYKKIPKLWYGKGWPMGDYPLWIELSHEGKFKRLPMVTAKYRILPDSASHGSYDKEVLFINAIRDVSLYYGQYHGIEVPNNGLSSLYYVSMMKTAFKHNCKDEAKKIMKEAKRNRMKSFKLMFYYYATILEFLGWSLRKYLNR